MLKVIEWPSDDETQDLNKQEKNVNINKCDIDI